MSLLEASKVYLMIHNRIPAGALAGARCHQKLCRYKLKHVNFLDKYHRKYYFLLTKYSLILNYFLTASICNRNIEGTRS